MVKKYFYTDSRKASLMLSAHNIPMYMGNYEASDYDAYSKHMAMMLIEDCHYRIRYLEKFRHWDKRIYILPDCHEMLKPQERDLIKWCENYFYTHEDEGKYYFHGLGGGDYHFNKAEESLERFLANGEIIRRNGKAFFMPEFEEAE